MARSKNIVDKMYKRFQKNSKDIPKNIDSKKAELIAKMKREVVEDKKEENN